MEVFFLSLAKIQILYYIGNQFVIKFYSFYDSPYITDRIFAKGNAYSYEHAFESIFINPVFATAHGNRMLVSQNRYTAVVAPELITKEMTKREMKARTEK